MTQPGSSGKLPLGRDTQSRIWRYPWYLQEKSRKSIPGGGKLCQGSKEERTMGKNKSSKKVAARVARVAKG